MRLLVPVVGMLLLFGCASSTRQPSASTGTAIPETRDFNDSAVAAALVFSPASDTPLLDLSRESRERTAFVGFEEANASFYYLQSDNHQFGGCSGPERFDRHDIVVRSGIIRR